jgi:hypothetical protein
LHPFVVVEVNVVINDLAHLLKGWLANVTQDFFFQASKESLHRGIIPAIAAASTSFRNSAWIFLAGHAPSANTSTPLPCFLRVSVDDLALSHTLLFIHDGIVSTRSSPDGNPSHSRVGLSLHAFSLPLNTAASLPASSPLGNASFLFA